MTKRNKVTIDADRVVIITENHGGYTAGRCLLCDESGWLAEVPFGLPYGSQFKPGNHLIHKKSCQMSQLLTEKGKLTPGH